MSDQDQTQAWQWQRLTAPTAIVCVTAPELEADAGVAGEPVVLVDSSAAELWARAPSIKQASSMSLIIVGGFLLLDAAKEDS